MWRFLKKLGIKPPYAPAIPFLGTYPEEIKIERDTCIPLFIAALFTIAITWKQPRCPSTEEWIKKLWYRYDPRAILINSSLPSLQAQPAGICRTEKESITSEETGYWSELFVSQALSLELSADPETSLPTNKNYHPCFPGTPLTGS